MFAKFMLFVVRAQRSLAVMMTVLEVIGGVVEAARASGYNFPGQRTQASA